MLCHKVPDLIPVLQLLIVVDPVANLGIISKLKDRVGIVVDYTFMGVKGVEQGVERTILRGTSVEGQDGANVMTNSDQLVCH